MLGENGSLSLSPLHCAWSPVVNRQSSVAQTSGQISTASGSERAWHTRRSLPLAVLSQLRALI
jgi:hypothetical protein